MRENSARKSGRRQGKNWGRFMLFAVAIATSLFVIRPVAKVGITPLSPPLLRGETSSLLAVAELPSSSLPSPQAHPLPPTLAQWSDTTSAGDYFYEIKLTPVGYLVWSHFPIKIYVERPENPAESSASVQRFQKWVDTVLQAIREWNVYLPLKVVAQANEADILILHKRPPLRTSVDRKTGKFSTIRARTAETRYEFYLRNATNTPEKLLSQRFTIELSPDQSVDYTLATARHELGHTLGIWGHSPFETDTMYFSQVRNPPQISVRDINTLKQIYQQPTRLGWPVVSQSSGEKRAL